MGNHVWQFLKEKRRDFVSFFRNWRAKRAGIRDSPSSTGLRELTWESEESSKPRVLCRKVEDARRVILKWLGADYQDLYELFCPLTEKEENEVFHALHGIEGSEILVNQETSNIEITTENIKCLSGDGWLNDEVINVYLVLLKEREKREPRKFLKCHFFNTFFYKKLTIGGTGYDFNAVRRWTSRKKLGYDLIHCDKIFVPIHKFNHWCLVVVDISKQAFQYLDSYGGGMDGVVLNILARYLVDEVEDKNGKEINIRHWNTEPVNNLPQQKNSSDCGMFMLKYCDFYSRGLSLCFGQENMEYFRKRTVKEILYLKAE